MVNVWAYKPYFLFNFLEDSCLKENQNKILKSYGVYNTCNSKIYDYTKNSGRWTYGILISVRVDTSLIVK